MAVADLAGEAFAVDVDGSAGEVVEGVAVGSEGEAEVAVAENWSNMPARREGSEVMRSRTSTRPASGTKRKR